MLGYETCWVCVWICESSARFVAALAKNHRIRGVLLERHASGFLPDLSRCWIWRILYRRLESLNDNNWYICSPGIGSLASSCRDILIDFLLWRLTMPWGLSSGFFCGLCSLVKRPLAPALVEACQTKSYHLPSASLENFDARKSFQIDIQKKQEASLNAIDLDRERFGIGL